MRIAWSSPYLLSFLLGSSFLGRSLLLWLFLFFFFFFVVFITLDAVHFLGKVLARIFVVLQGGQRVETEVVLHTAFFLGARFLGAAFSVFVARFLLGFSPSSSAASLLAAFYCHVKNEKQK